MSNFTHSMYSLGESFGLTIRSFFITATERYYAASASPQSGSSYYTLLTTTLKQIKSFPSSYKKWWFRLLDEDPIHVYIETVLVAFVLYMLVCKQLQQQRNKKGKGGGVGEYESVLSEAEREELIREWKPEPLAPPLLPTPTTTSPYSSSSSSLSLSSRWATNGMIRPEIVIQKVLGSRIIISSNSFSTCQDESRSYNITDNCENTDRVRRNIEEEEELDGTVPPDASVSSSLSSSSSSCSKFKTRTVLNMASHDFLGFSTFTGTAEENVDMDDDVIVENGTTKKDNSSSAATSTSYPTSIVSVKDAARAALNRYGCGSCGPRGFYGTIDAHLLLEESVAKFLNAESSIMYSDGASAASSTVAAFAKRGDMLVVDEGINEALQTGVTLSRATVRYFRHNDMDDLRRVLESIRLHDTEIGRKPCDIRRFIIVEGLYKNHGTVCPLSKLVKLKQEYSYRLILDESLSFGTLGPSGRGCMEHYNLKITKDVEILIVSLENTLASIGGLCVGNYEVVDHQRLSGAGYCFSASAPPFVAAAALASLDILGNGNESGGGGEGVGKVLVKKLIRNRDLLYQGLKQIKEIQILSSELSPVAFFRLAQNNDHDDDEGNYSVSGRGSSSASNVVVDKCGETGRTSSSSSSTPEPPAAAMNEQEERQILDQIAMTCLKEQNVVIISTSHVGGMLNVRPQPSCRMIVTAAHSSDDIQEAIHALKKAIKKGLRSSDGGDDGHRAAASSSST